MYALVVFLKVYKICCTEKLLQKHETLYTCLVKTKHKLHKICKVDKVLRLLLFTS